MDSKNFKYLDDLIHSGEKEIVLDSDIVLSDGEESEYRDGIELYRYGLTIDGNGHTIDARRKARIFHCTGENITIKNIVLKNGYAEEDHDSGGGAILNAGELTICDSTFTGNTVMDSGTEYTTFDYVAYCESGGGAIYNSGELAICRCILSNNVVERYTGGAIHNGRGGVLTITDSTLTENSTSDDDGGAIFNWGELAIVKSTLKNNMARLSGGAICNCGVLTIDESVLDNNMSKVTSGAIYDEEGELTITKSTFTNNLAKISGGAIYKENGRLTITDSTFSNNTAESGGGAIVSCAKTAIKDSAFEHNTAHCGGGAIIASGKLTIEDSSFTGNTAQKSGGGAIITDWCDVIITSSILAANKAIRGGAISNSVGGELTIKDSTFTQNSAQTNGGAINNWWVCSISESTFDKNIAQNDGGAIFNDVNDTNSDTKLIVSESSFTQNTAFEEGGAICLKQFTKYESNDCTFKSNNPNNLFTRYIPWYER